jgi:hypothetical protein
VVVGTAALVLAVLVGALGHLTQGSSGGGEGSCAALVTWNGHTYRGQTADQPLDLGAELPGSAVLAGCKDSNLDATGSTRVTAVKIVGVPSSRKIAVTGLSDARATEWLRDP